MSPLLRTFCLGAGLILLTNAVMFGGVYYNRSGEPGSVLQLTERELSVAYRGFLDEGDDSSKVLRLDFRVAPGWVTADKLRELGFTVWRADGQVEDWDERSERAGLVVLEMDGPAHQKELQLAEAALAEAKRVLAANPEHPRARDDVKSASYEIERLTTLASRLYIVDAGLDAAALRQRYPDTHRYAVAQASLRYGASYSASAAEDGVFSLYADVTDLNVSNQWRTVFEGWHYYDRDADERSKVRVDLAFGQRIEPWVVGATRVE